MSDFLRKLHFILFSGKNPKWKYYLSSYCRMMVPYSLLRSRLPKKLAAAHLRSDYPTLVQRRDYYCRLQPGDIIGKDAETVGSLHPKGQKVYYLDTIRYARWFSPKLPIRIIPGDITYIPEYPSFTKSRPIKGDNANSVLLNLNRIRHFIFVKDRIPFREKQNTVLFRGKVHSKEQRLHFMERWFGHPMVDAGDVSRRSANHPEWIKPKLTIGEQLKHKFIMAIEGNDVASNLKWIMSSNSVAVMPRPTYETWFMEGTLKPGYHYVEVKPDFSDLLEKVEYYTVHPEEAEAIISNAHDYVAQFLDPQREDLISLMVVEKYLASVTS